MLFNARRTEYAESEGPVRYLDGSGLARPLDMPKPALAVMGAFVIVAAVIGGVFLFNVLDDVVNSAARAQASVEENLARPVALDLPSLPALFTQDDASIKQSFADAGYTTYEISADEAGGFDLLKLPSDVGLAEAAVMYSNINSLSAADAALILNGSWRLEVARGDYTDMRVRYADFASGSIETAIQNAMVAEGLDATELADSGTDDAGNTFRSGTVDIAGESCTWRVSAIALSSVYDIKGLPETAVYVGVRITP